MNFEQLKAGYKVLWDKCEVTRTAETKKEAEAIIAAKAHYTGYKVPWFVVGIIHVREAGSPPDFKAVLHNGERIVGTGRKTRLVPKNRGPFSDWHTATVDALQIDHLDTITWDDGWGYEHVAYALEAFNGFGYRKHGIPSPYLWGGTNVQERGKFVADGRYDSGTMDPQIGGMALLKELMALDSSITFGKAPAMEPTPSDEPSATHPAEPLPTTGPSSSDEPPETDKPDVPPVKDAPKQTAARHKTWGTVGMVFGGALTWFHQHWQWFAIGGSILLAVYILSVLWKLIPQPEDLVETTPQLSPKTD